MILIVDSLSDRQNFLRNLIEYWGYLTDIACTDNEILKKISKRRFSLIIISIEKLEVNIINLIKTLNSYDSVNSIPILFVSESIIEREDIIKLNNFGVVDFLVQPLDSNVLFSRIKVLLKVFEQGLEVRRSEQKLQQEVMSRFHAQVELRDRVQYLHSILGSLPLIIFKADLNGTITFVNNKWFEYSTSALVFPEQDPKMDSIRKKFRECRYNNKALEYEIRIKNLKTGIYIYHLLRITPIVENGVIKKWIGTFTDIEDQKQVEIKKEEFLSIASHELRTPITSIKGYVQLLDRLTSSLDSSIITDIVKKAHHQVLSLETLISDLLDFTRINNEKFNMNFAYFDLERLITDVIFTFNQVNNHRGLKIIREGERITAKVFGDIYKIEQVLVNYLTNAIKYAPDSDLIIVRTSLKNKSVCVEVVDFGIGISEDKHANLFSKFYRVEDNSLSIQGLGIGLYICSEIIKQHNGSYGVNSLLGSGSQFYFTLPIVN